MNRSQIENQQPVYGALHFGQHRERNQVHRFSDRNYYEKFSQTRQNKPSLNNQRLAGKREALNKKLLEQIVSNHALPNLRFTRLKPSRTFRQISSTRSSNIPEVPSSTDITLMSKKIILEVLDSRLIGNKYLFIKHATKPYSLIAKGSNKTSDFEGLAGVDFSKLTLEEFRDISCKGKDQSLRFQDFVSTCSDSTLNNIIQRVVPDLNFILKNDYGNYLIQRIINRDPSFSTQLETYFKRDFFELAVNEFSSRAMQSLLYKSDSFRRFVMQTLEQRIDLCYSHISAAFLLSVSIGQAKNCAEFDYFRKLILAEIEEIVEAKFMKRVAVSLLERLDKEDLDVVFDRLNLGCNLEKHLSDKYYTYILLVFAENCHSRTMTSLVGLVQYKLSDLLQTKYFKFLVLSLVQQGRTEAVKTINAALRAACPHQIQRLASFNYDYIYFYCYLTVLTMKDDDSTSLRRFMKKMTSHFQLADHLRKF